LAETPLDRLAGVADYYSAVMFLLGAEHAA
jgi:hypothetical protein